MKLMNPWEGMSRTAWFVNLRELRLNATQVAGNGISSFHYAELLYR